MATASALGVLVSNAAAIARRPLPAELTLDAANPVIAVTIGGKSLRLRVDPAQWETIELNGAVADRLGLAWSPGRDVDVGRVVLPGRTAQAMLVVEGTKDTVLVSSHGQPAAADADGLIGPDLLPYATIRWQRRDAPAATDTLALPLMLDKGIGFAARDPALPLPIRLRFSFARLTSEATAAAGSFLVQRYGGAFGSRAQMMPVFLGVSRPARPFDFARAPQMAGFRFPSLIVRIADFRGDNPLPSDPAEVSEAGEIVVAKREEPQPAQSWVTIAADRLSRCAEVVYAARPLALSLTCAFDR